MNQGDIILRCWACKESKPISEFYKDCRKKSGVQGVCKPCSLARTKRWQAAHPDYAKQKGKEKYRREDNPARYARNREKFIFFRRRYGSTVIGRLHALLNAAKHRSIKRGIEFTLDYEWLIAKFDEQGGCCILTGLPFDVVCRNPIGVRKFNPFSPSLDRISPAVGYTPDNTRLVCTAINLALNDFGEDVFAKVARAYLERKGTG